MRATSQLRPALRAATAFPIDAATIDACVGAEHGVHDAAFRRARIVGLRGLAPGERSGGLWPVVGEVAESVAAVVLDELGFDLFWQLAKRGARGVDLLLLSPDGCVLALEVKGTLRAGTIPRLTRSRLRQLSREWLDRPDNPAMSEWSFDADDLDAGVMVVDLATSAFRLALSADFERYVPVLRLDALGSLRSLDGPAPG